MDKVTILLVELSNNCRFSRAPQRSSSLEHSLLVRAVRGLNPGLAMKIYFSVLIMNKVLKVCSFAEIKTDAGYN